MELALVAIAISIPLSLAGVFVTKILTNRHSPTKEVAKRIKQDYDAILKSKDEYIDELEEATRHYKNKASNMERGPKVEGNISELHEILPNLVEEFSPYAPKWLKPFLGDKDVQTWIIKYAQEHPDKAKDWFFRAIKSKTNSQSSNQSTETL